MLAGGKVDESYREKFLSAINDDLNMPLALSVLHELVHDKNIAPSDMVVTALNFDEVFGFKLGEKSTIEIPSEIIQLANKRVEAREAKNWAESDRLRDEIVAHGYTIKDTDKGFVLDVK